MRQESQSHAFAAFPPFLSRRSSLASPCLCRLKKNFVIPSHFCRKSEKIQNIRGWTHSVGKASPCSNTTHQTTHFLKATNMFLAVTMIMKLCASDIALVCDSNTAKHSVIHSVRFDHILPAGCKCVRVRAFATDYVDVCAGGCACHLMRRACVTVPLAGAASCEIVPAAGFFISLKCL